MIILASGSPRRKELLDQIGAEFVVQVSEAAEESGDELAPQELVKRNAIVKAQAVAREHLDLSVLGADTVVALDGHTYGKPCDKADACRMLRLFAGRTHEVSTGIALVYGGSIYADYRKAIFSLPTVCQHRRTAGQGGCLCGAGKGSSVHREAGWLVFECCWLAFACARTAGWKGRRRFVWQSW